MSMGTGRGGGVNDASFPTAVSIGKRAKSGVVRKTHDVCSIYSNSMACECLCNVTALSGGDGHTISHCMTSV